MLRLREPSPKQSRYRYIIEVSGAPMPAYLTYQLERQNPTRSLLLVDAAKASALLRHFPSDARKSLGMLEELIGSLRPYGGSTTLAKAVAVRLWDGDVTVEGAAVAVHKRGAVPVSLVGTVKDAAGNSLRIGLYPSVALAKARQGALLRHEFVDSLKIRPDVQIRRYLEDIGEDLHDIEQHLTLPEASERILQIKATLASSLEDKLNEFEGRRGRRRDPVRDVILGEYAPTLLTGRYAVMYTRALLLYFNDQVGIRDQSLTRGDRGKWTPRRIVELGRRLFDGDDADRRSLYPDIYDLHRAMVFLVDAVPDAYDRIRGLASEQPWVRHFIQFAAFVAVGRDRMEPASKAAVFISVHHGVPVSRLVAEQVKAAAVEHFASSIHLTDGVHELSGTLHEYLIERRIWHSDSVFMIVPKEARRASDGVVKDFSWLVKEAEYGHLLAKRLVSLVEQGTTLDVLLQDIEHTKDLFAPSYRAPRAERLERLRRSLKERTFVPFRLEVPFKSDLNLIEELSSEFERIRDEHATSLVQGVVAGLSSEARKFVRLLNGEGEQGLNKARLRSLFATKGHLVTPKWMDDAFAKVTARRVYVGSTPLVMATKSADGRRYAGRVRTTLKSLLPQRSDREIETLYSVSMAVP